MFPFELDVGILDDCWRFKTGREEAELVRDAVGMEIVDRDRVAKGMTGGAFSSTLRVGRRVCSMMRLASAVGFV